MDEVTHNGGCLCGEVRYTITRRPRSSSICHCFSCRKAAGAQSVAWLSVSTEDFSVVSGEPALYRSSAEVSRGFCGRCGTMLTYRHDGDPDSLDVTTASLDVPEDLAPTHHVWLEDKIVWESITDGLPQFERGGSPS
jgi:hypothetical protein